MFFRDLADALSVKQTGIAAFAASVLLFAPSAQAQEQTLPVVTDTSIIDVETEAETPWYEAFTLSMNESSDPLFSEPSTIDWRSQNGRWGVSLGIEDHSDERFVLEDVSAEAFVNFGDVRVGGQFRFTAPEDELFLPADSEDRQPEVKFESALRF
jgi:hypothetical protein